MFLAVKRGCITMNRIVGFVFVAGLLPELLIACQITGVPQPQTPTVAVTSTLATYTLTPGENVHRLPNKGEGFLYEGLAVGVSIAANSTTERQPAGLFIYNNQCYPLQSRTVFVGDSIEFAGYWIRVLDIADDYVVVAVSGQLLDPAQVAVECMSSTYNRLPHEEYVSLHRDSEKIGDLTFVSSRESWIEEYISASGEAITGYATDLRITSDQTNEVWEGIVHVGEIIEYGTYQIRIQVINKEEKFIGLVFGDLAEARSIPDEEQ